MEHSRKNVVNFDAQKKLEPFSRLLFLRLGFQIYSFVTLFPFLRIPVEEGFALYKLPDEVEISGEFSEKSCDCSRSSKKWNRQKDDRVINKVFGARWEEEKKPPVNSTHITPNS